MTTDVIHARCGWCHRLLDRTQNVVCIVDGYGWSFDTLACRSAWFSGWKEVKQ